MSMVIIMKRCERWREGKEAQKQCYHFNQSFDIAESGYMETCLK